MNLLVFIIDNTIDKYLYHKMKHYDGILWRNHDVAIGDPMSTGQDLPNLSRAKVISISTYTYDKNKFGTDKGNIVGVSVGADNDGRWYFPMRHVVDRQHNMDTGMVLVWLRNALGDPRQPKVGANISYDIRLLENEGVKIEGELIDVCFAEALLSDVSSVDLEVLGDKYVLRKKTLDILYQWSAETYGGDPTRVQRDNIYRCSPRLVEIYAKCNADIILKVIKEQYKLLQQDELLDVFEMECRLIRLTVAMQQVGVSVDVVKAEQLRSKLLYNEHLINNKLRSIVGYNINTSSYTNIAKAFDKIGLSYPINYKRNPSFTKDFLTSLNHPISKLISEKRKIQKIRNTFIESYVLNSQRNGKVYGQLHQLRNDSCGTRTGRFSSTKPNLQNIPARDTPMIRGLFVPDYGHKQWVKKDYNQIEYRFLAHYAVGPCADELRYAYNIDPNTDYHKKTQDLVFQKTLKRIDRKQAKAINFGLVYGMGKQKLATTLGLSKKDGDDLFRAYHIGCPFSKNTMDDVISECNINGKIRTILGRISRFDLWESIDYNKKSIAKDAVLKHNKIKRAYPYKALSYKLQGSSADMIKMGMLKCYDAGLFDVTGVPRLMVHDELDFSDPGGCTEAFNEIKNIMETCIPLRIPIVVDVEAGPDWGHLKRIKL